MATGFQLNSCQVCGVQLAPDDFDGICPECDNAEQPEADGFGGWSCKCGWWNVDCNHCRKCGESIREAKAE